MPATDRLSEDFLIFPLDIRKFTGDCYPNFPLHTLHRDGVSLITVPVRLDGNETNFEIPSSMITIVT